MQAIKCLDISLTTKISHYEQTVTARREILLNQRAFFCAYNIKEEKLKKLTTFAILNVFKLNHPLPLYIEGYKFCHRCPHPTLLSLLIHINDGDRNNRYRAIYVHLTCICVLIAVKKQLCPPNWHF